MISVSQSAQFRNAILEKKIWASYTALTLNSAFLKLLWNYHFLFLNLSHHFCFLSVLLFCRTIVIKSFSNIKFILVLSTLSFHQTLFHLCMIFPLFSSPKRSQLLVSSCNSSSACNNSVSDARTTLTLCLGKHSVILSGVRVTLTLLHQLVSQLQLSADNNLYLCSFMLNLMCSD